MLRSLPVQVRLLLVLAAAGGAQRGAVRQFSSPLLLLAEKNEAELDEEAAKYHQEDWGFLAQEKGASTSKDDLVECLKNLTVALQNSGIKLPSNNSKPSAPPLPPADAPSVVAGLDPPPGPPPPSEIVSPLQKALRQAQRLGCRSATLDPGEAADTNRGGCGFLGIHS
nr:uncharacterized protein LOC121817360 isoform X5 [Ovis aries]